MYKILDQNSLDGKKVIIRVDYNVPIINGVIQDNFRIVKSLPIIKYCLENNASVILLSHMGRPNGIKDDKLSLLQVKPDLEKLLDLRVLFSDNCVSPDAVKISSSLLPGQVHLLENLRFHNHEIDNDENFSYMLSRHGDIFINEAFGTAHRSHASNVGICNYIEDKYVGFLMQEEYRFLYEELRQPAKPYSVILGGAKVTGKIELINSLMQKADNILIGGAMAFTFMKAKGIDIGNSYYEPDNIDVAASILDKCRVNNIKLSLPIDVVVSDEIDNVREAYNCDVNNIPPKMKGFDVGINTCNHFKEIISTSRLIVWNGPLGVAEIPRYSEGTKFLANFIGSLHNEGVTTIIGGGDTSASVKHLSPLSEFTHISTGGGASLELLSGKELPAFKSINSKKKVLVK